MHSNVTALANTREFGSVSRRSAPGFFMIGLLLSVAGLIGFLGQGVAGSTTIEPQLVEGNPSCADLGYAHELKIENPSDGTYTDGVLTVTIDVVATGVVNWSSNLPVDAVIVKGGSAAFVYASGGATAGTELVTPINDGGNRPAISHISFCYDTGATTTTTLAPTTTTVGPTTTTLAPTTTTLAPTTTTAGPTTSTTVGGGATTTTVESTSTTVDLGGAGTTVPNLVGPGPDIDVSGGAFTGGAGFTGGTGGSLPFTGSAPYLFLVGVALCGFGALLLSLTRRATAERVDG
ncbi:MAG TPA: hypothetical protein VFZ83_08275 [Acidimicrobiia bacterium]|nr:hypothetical protein [Acidimicrobiia bacterium]